MSLFGDIADWFSGTPGGVTADQAQATSDNLDAQLARRLLNQQQLAAGIITQANYDPGPS